MKNSDKKLTTVRLNPELYEEFQNRCNIDRFSFQKLATRAMTLYLSDKEFRNKLRNLNIK